MDRHPERATVTATTARHVAIWIDHETAIVAVLVGTHLNAEQVLRSNAGPHIAGGVQWPQGHVEAHRYEVLKHYYDAVIHHLQPADEILILGPGQAKHELYERIVHHSGLKGEVITVRNAPKLTESELISRAEVALGVKVRSL